MCDNTIKMWDNIANKEDVVLDAIIILFISVLFLMFVVSFCIFIYGLVF